MSENYILVVTTVGSEEQAATLAHLLVERRLAACVQMHPVRSVYRWQGKVCDEAEYVLTIKTTERRYAELEQLILEHHPYERPEIVRLEIAGGSHGYLAWLGESVE
jgi:periplasmic divalent cation tolerance protein